MKNTISLIVAFLCVHIGSSVFGQNRFWIIPPNYVDFYTGQVHTLPNSAIPPSSTVSFLDLVNGTSTTTSGSPLSKTTDYPSAQVTYTGYRASNGVLNQDRSLELYINNAAIVVPGKTYVVANKFGNELPIIPVPEKCDYYFFVNNWTNTYNASTSSYTNTLNYKEISVGGTTVTNKSVDFTDIEGGNFLTYAITPYTKDPITNEIYGKLYTIVGYSIVEYKILSGGIQFVKKYSAFANGYAATELDISPNGRYLAFGNHSNTLFVAIFDLQTERAYYLRPTTGGANETCFVNGVEFSKDSQKIFFVYSSQGCSGNAAAGNGVGYLSFVPLLTGTLTENVVSFDVSNLSFVPNSSLLRNSFLETAIDNLMYISDGATLKGFNPVNPTAGIVKLITITNGPSTNPVSGNFNNYYTLVDQIDGADYSNLFRVGCELTASYSNVSSGSGTLPGTTKVANTLTAQTNVTVTTATAVAFKAGQGISLKPGFTVQLGGTFIGKLEYCQELVEDFCSGSTGGGGRVPNYGDSEVVLKVYPNPVTSGRLMVEVDVETESIEAEIFNALGQKIDHQRKRGVNKIVFDLTEKPNDLYFVKVKFNDEVQVRKIIVERQR